MSGYAETVAAWADHLRSGGQEPWSDFVEQARLADESPSHAHIHAEAIPTAAQLTLLWKLSPQVSRVDELADLIFATPAPGRGMIDIPLTWHQESPYGTPAHAPDDLPANEVLRQALGVLVALLKDAPPPTETPERQPLPLPWRPRFQVHGSPLTAAAVRRELRARRLHETDLRPVHLLLAQPLDQMMLEHWTARVRGGGIIKWHSLWRQATHRDRLPHELDIAARASRLRERGHDVQVILASTPAQVEAETVAQFGWKPRSTPPPINPAATDVHRRLNRLLTLTSGAEQADRLQPLLTRLLADRDAQPLGVPEDAEAWAKEQAELQVEALARGDYPVRGSLDALMPATTSVRTVSPQRALPVALAALADAWQQRKETAWPNA